MRRISKQSAEWDLVRVPAHRDSVEHLRRQADLLTGVDRTLLMMYLQAGCSFCQLGRMTGMNRSSVGRRIRRILRRLSDRTYARCLARRSRFSDREMAVLLDHFIRGLSMARIGRDQGLGCYRVRAIVEKARSVASCSEEASQGGPQEDGTCADASHASSVQQGTVRSGRIDV
jgi:hypothetical protein